MGFNWMLLVVEVNGFKYNHMRHVRFWELVGKRHVSAVAVGVEYVGICGS